MALVVNEVWETEAKRINDADGNFDVLGLVPPRVSVEDVKAAYQEVRQRLVTKESIRNPAVQRAKHLLGQGGRNQRLGVTAPFQKRGKASVVGI